MTKVCTLTCGEPASIAPELIIKAWRARVGPFFVIGPPELYASVPIYIMTRLNEPIEAHFSTHLPCFPLQIPSRVRPGIIDLENTRVALKSLSLAADFVQHHASTHALVTLPLEKKACYDIGFSFPGHTEFLAYQAGLVVDDVSMLFTCRLENEVIRSVPLTIHIPLREVAFCITIEKILRTVHILLKEFPGFRVAIAALNPHAGEQGAIGDEEMRVIQPAIHSLQNEGIKISGPYSADTLFADFMRATYDIALCMYHDQALIPIKTLAFYRGVNRTLGLGFVRTSPDHGTALACAGTGKANPESLIEAIRIAQTA